MRCRLRGTLAALCVMLAACGGGGGGGSGSESNNGPPPQNSAPTFGGLTFTTTEDSDLSARLTATDAEGDAVTFAQASNPAKGSVMSFDAATGQLTYRPNSNVSGTDTFGVRATDAGGRVTNGTVTITIDPVNDAPTASAAAVTTNQAMAVSSRIVATDVESDALSYTLVRDVSGGTLSLAADGSFTYQSRVQFSGDDSFEVDVTDAHGASVRVTVPITVAAADIAYSGVQTQVVIREDNAALISKKLLSTFTRLVAINERGVVMPAATGTVDLLQSGEVSGTAHITGTLDATGNGTVRIDYTDFVRTPGTTFNGVEIRDIDISVPSVRRTYKGTTVNVDGTSMVVSGSLLRKNDGVLLRVLGSVVLVMPDGSTEWVRDADLAFRGTFMPRPHFFSLNTVEWSGSTRIYDPVLGYSEVTLDGGFQFQRVDTRVISNLARPIGRGSIAATGAAQARLWLTSLSPYTFSIELDLAGRGRPEKALAFRRRDNFTVATGSDASHLLQAAVALPIDTVFAQVGTAFYPEGRFSEHREGKFLTHRWFIDKAPPGSMAQLALADTPRPTLTPDRRGDYLLRLEVSAEGATSTDYLLVASHADGDDIGNVPWIDERAIPGASDSVDVGQEVTLDARKSYGLYQDPETLDYRWTVIRMDATGSHSDVVVNAVPGAMIRYTPDAPGSYYAMFHRPDTTSAALVTKTFVVHPFVRFSPPARLSTNATDRQLVMDLDGDGQLDIFGPTLAPFSPVVLHRGRPGGGFEDGVTLSNVSDLGSTWFEDLTGDGRLDLIRGGESEQVSVAVQQASGQFAAPVTLDNGVAACSTGAYARALIGSIDIDRNGRNDLIRSEFCNDGNRRMIVYMSTASGFAPGQDLALPGGVVLGAGATGDIDGDGDRDLVGIPPFVSQLPSTVLVLKLDANGTFDSTTVQLSEEYQSLDLAIRDFNNDGRADILVARSPVFLLTQDASGSFVETAKFPVYLDRYVNRASLPAGDFNGDGLLDLMLRDNSSNITNLWVQQPNGTFLSQPVFNGADGSYLDVNGDGRADIVGAYVRVTAPQ